MSLVYVLSTYAIDLYIHVNTKLIREVFPVNIANEIIQMQQYDKFDHIALSSFASHGKNA